MYSPRRKSERTTARMWSKLEVEEGRIRRNFLECGASFNTRCRRALSWKFVTRIRMGILDGSAMTLRVWGLAKENSKASEMLVVWGGSKIRNVCRMSYSVGRQDRWSSNSDLDACSFGARVLPKKGKCMPAQRRYCEQLNRQLQKDWNSIL